MIYLRKMNENEARLLNTLETVTEQMAAAVSCCSRDLRYLWANRAYANWIQRPLNEIVGHPILDVLGKDAFEVLLPHFNRVLIGETVRYERETNFRGIGPRWTSVTYTPTLDVNGVANGWVAVVLDVTERKRAEEARFSHTAIIESSEDAIICKNLHGVITSWNAGAQRLFGYTEAEVSGQPITILIPHEFRDEENKILELLRAGGRIEHYETKRLTKAGNRVDVSLIIGPVRDSTGRIVGFSKIAHDITQRKRTEKALQESEQRFRLVADTAPVLIWMSGIDKLCTYFNKPWLDFTGRSIDSELGNGWTDRIHPEDLQRCLGNYTQSFDRREKFRMEYRLRRHDGEYRWILDIGVPRFDQDRSFVGYIGICVDVTERKRMEEALQHREKELSEAQRLAGVGSWRWDTKIDKVIWSEELYRLHGRDPKLPAPSFKEHPSLFTAESWERLQGVVKEALQTGAPYELDVEILSPESTTKWATARGEPLRDAGDQVIGFRGTVQDITERKLAEAELGNVSRKLIEAQEQERNRIGRELHDDIGQRLAMVAVQLQQVRDETLVLPEVHTSIGELGKEISEIAVDIQSLSHELHSAKLQYLGVAAAMRGFCQEFGEQQKLKIDFQTHDLPSPLAPDISLCFYRVLQEALHNSAKHSGVRDFDVRLWGTSDEIHLSVKDSGAGFDREAAKRSRGLGLVSMEERLKLVKGTLSINSEPRVGTTIHAHVPFDSTSGSGRAAG